MVNAAICSLHRKHPVQIVLDFGKQVRQGTLGRNIPLERLEIFRKMFVKRKERVGGNARIHDIATVVTGIVPALGSIDGPRCTRRIMELSSRIRMASSTFPLSRIGFFKRHRSTLVIEPLERSLHHIFVSLARNLQVGTERLSAHLDGIGSGILQFRKIDQLHILSALIPVRRHGRGHRQNGLTARIRDFHIAATFSQSEFLDIARTITDLVDIRRSGISSSCQRKQCDRKGDILL